MTAHIQITTATDLTDEGNAVTARLEYDRAVDSGDDAALARWARRWGLPALQAAQEGRDGDSSGCSWPLCRKA